MLKTGVIVASLLLLTGCASAPVVKPTESPKQVVYSVPADCEIKELLALDASYQALDQTEAAARNRRDCVVGTPNSDVGIFFSYSQGDEASWADDSKKALGFEAFDSGLKGVTVLRDEVGSEEEGTSCNLMGYISGLEFTIEEPWAKCDDKWNKELVGYVVNHAVKP